MSRLASSAASLERNRGVASEKGPGGSPVTFQSWIRRPSTVLKPGMEVLGMVKMALERLKAGESLAESFAEDRKEIYIGMDFACPAG